MIVFIVNNLILIYFTWFVYTFVNYKYNVLLKRNDVFLMALSTFVISYVSMKGKKSEYFELKLPSNPMLNVVVKV